MKQFKKVTAVILALSLLGGCANRAMPSIDSFADETSIETSVKNQKNSSITTQNIVVPSATQESPAVTAPTTTPSPSTSPSQAMPTSTPAEQKAETAVAEPTVNPTVEPIQPAAVQDTASVAIDLQEKVYSAKGADTVSEDTKEAFLAWFQADSDLQEKYVSDAWTWEYSLWENGCTALTCYGPEDTAQSFLFNAGDVSWGPTGQYR